MNNFLSRTALCLLALGYCAGWPEEPLASPQTAQLTLGDAVSRVLRQSPALDFFSYDIRAAEARQIQARARPNPELSLEVEDIGWRGGSPPATHSRAYGGQPGQGLSIETSRETTEDSSAFSEAEITLSLAHVIELGGKRHARMLLAERERIKAACDYEIARLDILESTAQAFVQVLADQERVALNEELVTLAQNVLETVAARAKAGRVSPLETKKAETALETARVKAQNAARALQAARTALAALWGEYPAQFERVEGDLETVSALCPLDRLSWHIADNPTLALWNAEIEKRHAAVAVERARAVPDLTVTGGIRALREPAERTHEWTAGRDGAHFRETTRDGEWDGRFVVGFSIPLPILDRNQGAIEEARQYAAKALAERRAAVLEIQAALEKAYQESSAAYSAAESLRNNVLPAARETFEAINEAYRQGKFEYLDVLDAQRTLFDAREQYLEWLTQYHLGMAAIERLIDGPCDRDENSEKTNHEEQNPS